MSRILLDGPNEDDPKPQIKIYSKGKDKPQLQKILTEEEMKDWDQHIYYRVLEEYLYLYSFYLRDKGYDSKEIDNTLIPLMDECGILDKEKLEKIRLKKNETN